MSFVFIILQNIQTLFHFYYHMWIKTADFLNIKLYVSLQIDKEHDQRELREYRAARQI